MEAHSRPSVWAGRHSAVVGCSGALFDLAGRLGDILPLGPTHGGTGGAERRLPHRVGGDDLCWGEISGTSLGLGRAGQVRGLDRVRLQRRCRWCGHGRAGHDEERKVDVRLLDGRVSPWSGADRCRDRRTTLGGAVGLQSGFLVALKQLVPEHTVAMANGLLKVRVKHLPASFLLAQTIVGVVLRDDGDVVLAWMGFYVSWIYLRFYKARPDPSSASASGQGPSAGGDGSDSFTLAAFFPHPISVAVAAVSDRVYDVLMATRRCAPFSADDGHEQAMAREEAGLTRLADHRPGRRGGGKREEAERRRALALRALDQRLHAVANRPATAAAAAAAAVAQPHHATTATTYDDVHRPLLTHPAD